MNAFLRRALSAFLRRALVTSDDEVKCSQGLCIAPIPAGISAVMGGRLLIKDAGARKGEPRDNFIGDVRSTHDAFFFVFLLKGRSI